MESAGIPSSEVTESAYKSLIEFGVVGAVLAIILIAMLGIVWWSLLTSRRRDKEHAKAMEDKDTEHRNALLEMETRCRSEREEAKTQEEKRYERYTSILIDKDKTIADIQEKRVELASMAVEAITKTNGQVDDLVDLVEIVVKEITELLPSIRRIESLLEGRSTNPPGSSNNPGDPSGQD